MPKWAENKLRQIVSDSKSYAQCLRQLDLPLHGGNYNTLKRKIQEYEIDIDHFTHEATDDLKGKGGTKIPFDEILVKNSTYSNTYHLKNRLLKNGILQDVCSRCDRSMWMGKKLNLHLDHINGVNNDHRLENLRLLCPNCHSQTPTYCGKNRKGFSNVCIDCDDKITRRATRCVSCHHKHRTSKKECPDCGVEISKAASRCADCSNKSRREFDPTPEKLKQLVWEMPAAKVGNHFGVSGRAVKKRCRKYGIETPGRGYWTKKRANS